MVLTLVLILAILMSLVSVLLDQVSYNVYGGRLDLPLFWRCGRHRGAASPPALSSAPTDRDHRSVGDRTRNPCRSNNRLNKAQDTQQTAVRRELSFSCRLLRHTGWPPGWRTGSVGSPPADG